MVKVINAAINPFGLHRHGCVSRSVANGWSHGNLVVAVNCLLDGRGDRVPSPLTEGVLELYLPSQLVAKWEFYSPVALVEEDDIIYEGERVRRGGEPPRPYREVVRDYFPRARSVQAIFYSSSLLEQEGEEHVLPAEEGNWELISLNCFPDQDISRPPALPATLRANRRGETGATRSSCSEEEYEKELERSLEYWKSRAFIRVE